MYILQSLFLKNKLYTVVIDILVLSSPRINFHGNDHFQFLVVTTLKKIIIKLIQCIFNLGHKN